MKKTKLFTSIAALALVLGLGACEVTSEEETTPSESETTTETTDTSESTPTTPSEDPDGYVLVGDFTDSNWDAKVDTSSKYYIPLGTTEYKATVTIADEPDYGEYDPWAAGLRVVEWGDSWNLVVGSDDLAEGSAEGLYGDDSKNIKVSWGETYDITVTFGDTNSILVTVHEDGENEGEGEGATYKLGAANPSTGVYYYFSGSTRSTTETNLFLATTTSWDEAAAVTITDLTSGGQSLSFVDGEGKTKYIAWDGENGNTSIQLYDEAYTWYWVESINGYCNASDGNASSRFLALYASGPDFRAYNPNDTYLPYGHVAAYTEEPETITPATPEAPDLELVTSLTDGGEYYWAYNDSGTYRYFNGKTTNTYYLDVTDDIDSAVLVKTTAVDGGWKLTFNNDASTIFAYPYSSSLDFEISTTGTSSKSGASSTWEWDTTYNIVTITLSNGKFYPEYYNSRIQGNGYSYINDNGSPKLGFQFYSLVTA